VWQTNEIIDLRLIGTEFNPSPGLLSSSLLRFVPVRLVLDAGTDLSAARFEPTMRDLNLTSIVAKRKLTDDAAPAVLTFLTSPLAPRLETVELNPRSCPSNEFIRTLSGLPRLQSLTVTCSEEASATYLAPLADAPSLTLLHLNLWNYVGSCAPLLQPLLQCAQLQRLSLFGARFGEYLPAGKQQPSPSVVQFLEWCRTQPRITVTECSVL